MRKGGARGDENKERVKRGVKVEEEGEGFRRWGERETRIKAERREHVHINFIINFITNSFISLQRHSFPLSSLLPSMKVK